MPTPTGIPPWILALQTQLRTAESKALRKLLASALSPPIHREGTTHTDMHISTAIMKARIDAGAPKIIQKGNGSWRQCQELNIEIIYSHLDRSAVRGRSSSPPERHPRGGRSSSRARFLHRRRAADGSPSRSLDSQAIPR